MGRRGLRAHQRLKRSVAEDAVAGHALAGGEWVLDVGCGDGFLTRTIAGMAPGGFVVGVDPSLCMIDAAHAIPVSGHSGPRFVRGDARRLDRPPIDVLVDDAALNRR
jgi:trans-aconitate 2-methyltransferase